jgi:parallel beta-helix repeat protein
MNVFIFQNGLFHGKACVKVGLKIKSKHLIALLIVILIVLSSFAYINVRSELNTSALPQLSVSIAPAGPIQLTMNQTQFFVASVNNTDFSLSYAWSIENLFRSFSVNGTDYVLLTNGNQASFKFLGSLIDLCYLSVKVDSSSFTEKTAIVTIHYLNPPSVEVKQTNQQGVNEQNNQQTQSQNTNQNDNPKIVYVNSPSNARFIIQTDSPSHYQVINGINGSIVTDYSSTSANDTLNNAIASGGNIAIMSGDYSGTQLNVPANANIIAEPGVTGIKYSSIADGARINEPTFNAAFGGYQLGNYTVTTNSTSSASDQMLYLAFKPDNTIYYASNNASYVLNNLANQAGGIFVKGNITLNSPIIFSKRGTSLFSDGTGQLWFKNVDGLYITTTEVNVYNIDVRQMSYERTKTGITFLGNYLRPIGYETLNNLKVWGWNTALSMNYTVSSKISNIDTTYSYTALNIFGQSVNNFFSNCLFSNYGNNQTTILIQRDNELNLLPEGNKISNSLVYGGNTAIDLQYAFASQISNSIIDGWKDKGIRILGSQDNSISDNWIGCGPSASNSIGIEVNSDASIISGNTFLAYNLSIYIYSSLNPLINNNIFQTASAFDIYSMDNNGGSISNNNFCAPSQIGIALQNSDGFSIFSNTFTGKGTAINMINSKHNSVVSNILNGTLQTGIILDGCNYITITGNSIYDSSQKTNNTYSDIWLVDNSTYNSVCDNTITASSNNKSAWGIIESSLMDDYNIYSGNIIKGQILGAIGIKGVHSLLGANITNSG